MGTKITRDVLESRLRCKFKAHLKLAGVKGSKSDYEAIQLRLREEVRQMGVEKILAKHAEDKVARSVPLTDTTLRAGCSFLLDANLEEDDLSLIFDGVKKVDGATKLGDFHYVPMLFHEKRKVGKEERRLLEVYALLLARIQGKVPAYGIVWHGSDGKATTVRLNSGLLSQAQLLQELKEMAAPGSQPKLLLNDHCPMCEFKQRCHAQAVQEDNLSLLRGIGEKEIKRHSKKGIVTVGQLSYTFRAGRSRKQAKPIAKHDYALQARAIRKTECW